MKLFLRVFHNQSFLHHLQTFYLQKLINYSLKNKIIYFTLGKEIEAKLQTATSSGEVYYTISVHRLDY